MRNLRKLDRREFLAVAATGVLAVPEIARAKLPRIVSLDYGLASTLLSLGIEPVGVAASADWNKWVVDPALPQNVADVGDALNVNLEALLNLKPDLILTTPYLDPVKPRLEAIAPVLRLSVFDPSGGDILPKAYMATRRLGAHLGVEAAADRFLAEADDYFKACRTRIGSRQGVPIATVNFMDARHVRIYTAPGLFDNVLERIGLRNAWEKEGHYWGFSTIGIEELAVLPPETHLIGFQPLPTEILPTLSKSPLWRELPFVQKQQFHVLPATLMFGMVNEAKRFAGQMAGYVAGLS